MEFDAQVDVFILGERLKVERAKAGLTQAMHDHIYAGIDENGRLYDPILEKSDYDFLRIKEHPDTGKVIEGCQLKNIDKLRELVKQISGYLPMTPYLIFGAAHRVTIIKVTSSALQVCSMRNRGKTDKCIKKSFICE